MGRQHRHDWEQLCQALLRADPDIRDIVQFGSSVYAPDLALDVDLLVTTTAKKDSDVYWDAVADWPVNVDVVVREPGERMGQSIALAICAWPKVLHGDGVTLKEARETMTIPTFDEARIVLTAGDRYLQDASETEGYLQDRHYRTAFDALFHAARHAVMTYLSTDETRWGELQRRLRGRHYRQFRRFINVLHVAYGYRGEYPRPNVEEEFRRWREQVSQFIDALEQEGER